MGAKATFDPVTRIIKLTEAPDVNGEIALDVQVDLYGDMKEDWLNDPTLRKYRPPITTLGGQPLPGSKTLGDTYFLASDWKIEPYDADQRLLVNGNFYSIDGTSVFIKPTGGTYAVMLELTVSNLVDSTVAQLSEIEHSSFNDGVTIDVVNGVGGTAYPVGSGIAPVNNLTDAKIIAGIRGFDKIYIKGDLTLIATDVVSGFTIVGEGASFNNPKTTLTLTDGCSTSNTEIYDCFVEGNQGGEVVYKDSVIGALVDTHCQFFHCGMVGPVQMVNSGWTVNHLTSLKDCYTTDEWYTLDYNDSPIQQVYSNFSGRIRVSNFTNASANLTIQLDSGEVWLDSTCTGGSITIRGTGTLIDDSSGVTLDIDGLMNKNTVAGAVGEEIGAEIQYASFGGGVTVDLVSGVSGTGYPTGTQQQPVDNFTDALVIASSRGFSVFYIIGDATFGASINFSGKVFIGESQSKSVFTIEDSANVLNAEFGDATVQGVLDGNAKLKNCLILSLTYVEGFIEQCILGAGTITLQGDAHFLDCWGGVVLAGSPLPEIDMGGTGASLGMRNYNGDILLSNMTGVSDNIEVNLNAGTVTLDSTITNGTATINGVGKVTNNSTGAATVDLTGLLEPDNITTQFLDTQIGTHDQAGSLGRTFVSSSYGGRVYIDTVNGTAGDTYPVGLFTNPVDNLADALTIATKYGASDLHVHSSLTIPSGTDLRNFVISGHEAPDVAYLIIQAGALIENAIFRGCSIRGVCTGRAEYHNCHIDDYSDAQGMYFGCNFNGYFSLLDDDTNHVFLHDCKSLSQTPVAVTVGDAWFNCSGWYGMMYIAGKTGAGEFNAHGHAGMFIVDNTNVAGNIYLAGTMMHMGAVGAGCTLNTSGIISSTYMKAMYQYLFNRSVVDDTAKTITIYDDDKVTPLFVFPYVSAGAAILPIIEKELA